MRHVKQLPCNSDQAHPMLSLRGWTFQHMLTSTEHVLHMPAAAHIKLGLQLNRQKHRCAPNRHSAFRFESPAEVPFGAGVPFGSSPSFVAMSQSTHRTGSVRGSVHLPSLFATIAYLVQGRWTVSAFRMPLRQVYQSGISQIAPLEQFRY